MAILKKAVGGTVDFIGADGKGERTIYHAPEGTEPFLLDWSPDGSRILFSLARPDFKQPQLALLSVSDGAAQFLENPPAGAHAPASVCGKPQVGTVGPRRRDGSRSEDSARRWAWRGRHARGAERARDLEDDASRHAEGVGRQCLRLRRPE